MSAPVIWIVTPVLIALGLWFLRHRTGWVTALGVTATLILGLLAQVVKIGDITQIGPWSVKIIETLPVLGRSLTITADNQPLLMMVFLIAGLWFLGSPVTQPNTFLVPLGLAAVSLLVAALAVKPFLYAALLIEMAVLCTIPILAPPRQNISKAVLRYLIFQTLGMPFILFTGWMLTGVESGPADPELAQRATLLLGLGFAFLLAVVPFHTWIPLLTEEADPYPIGFVFTIFPVVIFFIGLTFIDGYVWLRENANLFPFFRLVGTMMIVIGGGWALFQKHLGRMMGFAVIMISGVLLVSVGLGSQGGFQLFSGQLVIRFIAFWLWSLSLAVIAEHGGELAFDKTGSFLARFPFASVGLLMAHLSLAGFPLLAGFPTRLTLFILMAQQEPGQTWWIFAGNLGLVTAALRTLSGLGDREMLAGKRMEEKPAQVFLMILGMLLLLAIGWFPQLFLAETADLIAMFQHLVGTIP